MKNKSIKVLLMVCVLIFTVTSAVGSVWAADSDCSITARLPRSAEYITERDVALDIYRIGAVVPVQGGGLAAVAVDHYDSLDWQTYNDATFGEEGEKSDVWVFAQEAAKLALPSSPLDTMMAGEKFAVDEGVYLLIPRPSDGSGDYLLPGDEVVSVIHGTHKTDYHFSPVVVTVVSKELSGNAATANPSIVLKPDKNTWGDVTIKKVDAKTGEVLSGAVFKLYSQLEGLSSDVLIVRDVLGGEEALYWDGNTYTSGSDGTFVLHDLEPGVLYALVETVAPDGYTLLKKPIFFYIKESDGGNIIRQLTLQDGVEIDSGNLSYEAFVSNNILHYEVTNESSEDRYVRVKTFSNSRHFYLENFFGNGWIDGGDGYWYYTEKLAAGETTNEWLAAFGINEYYAPEDPEEMLTVDARNDFFFVYESSTVQYPALSGSTAPGGGSVEGYEPILLKGNMLVVENDSGVQTPETGGMGTAAFHTAGAFLIALAAILIAVRYIAPKKAQNR